jgi:membrane-bound lytic murein transglycosylase D
MDENVPDLNRMQNKTVEQRAIEAVSSSPEKGDKQSSKNRYHTVQQGETLYNISRIHGLTVEEIKVINRLSDSAVIYPGQKILISP